MRCTRCGRVLKRAAQTVNRFGVVKHFGPRCALLAKPDPRQAVLELNQNRQTVSSP